MSQIDFEAMFQKAIEDTDKQQAEGITVEDIFGLNSFKESMHIPELDELKR